MRSLGLPLAQWPNSTTRTGFPATGGLRQGREYGHLRQKV